MFVLYINSSALQALIFLSFLTVLKSDYSEPAPVTGSVREHLVLVPLVTVHLCMATWVHVSCTSLLVMGICRDTMNCSIWVQWQQVWCPRPFFWPVTQREGQCSMAVTKEMVFNICHWTAGPPWSRHFPFNLSISLNARGGQLCLWPLQSHWGNKLLVQEKYPLLFKTPEQKARYKIPQGHTYLWCTASNIIDAIVRILMYTGLMWAGINKALNTH